MFHLTHPHPAVDLAYFHQDHPLYFLQIHHIPIRSHSVSSQKEGRTRTTRNLICGNKWKWKQNTDWSLEVYSFTQKSTNIYSRRSTVFSPRERGKKRKNCDRDEAMWGSHTGKKEREKRNKNAQRWARGGTAEYGRKKKRQDVQYSYTKGLNSSGKWPPMQEVIFQAIRALQQWCLKDLPLSSSLLCFHQLLLFSSVVWVWQTHPPLSADNYFSKKYCRYKFDLWMMWMLIKCNLHAQREREHL